ncbi:MAG: hypothetical protein ACQGVC_12265 [Myxococcota bacterium]
MPLRSLLSIVLLLALAEAASAQSVTITFTGTIGSVSGELVGTVSASDAFSGSITYDASTAGTFTASPNPMFVRDEMDYTGAITAVSLTLVGDTVTGASGDIKVWDADHMFAGSDAFETATAPGSGTIGGYTVTSLAVNPEYDYTTWSLTSGSPLPQPPPYASTVFTYVSLSTAGGGLASGSLDSLVVTAAGPPAVPALPPWALLALAGSLGGLGLGWARRTRREGGAGTR